MRNTESKPTTLTLSEKTKKQLAEFGKKGETFDTILQRVMDNTNTLCNKQSNNNDVDVEEENDTSSL